MGETLPPECSICFEAATADLAAITCGHVFHLKCVEKWLASTGLGAKAGCPICRKPCGSRLCLRFFWGSADTERPLSEAPEPLVERLREELMTVRSEKLALQARLDGLEEAAKAHAEELAAVERRCAAAAEREKIAAAAAAAAAEKELQQTLRQLVVEQAKTRKAVGQLELARQQQAAAERTLQGLIGEAPAEDRAKALLSDFKSWGRLEDAVLTLHRAMTVLQRDKERLRKEKLRQERTARRRLLELQKALNSVQDPASSSASSTNVGFPLPAAAAAAAAPASSSAATAADGGAAADFRSKRRALPDEGGMHELPVQWASLPRGPPPAAPTAAAAAATAAAAAATAATAAAANAISVDSEEEDELDSLRNAKSLQALKSLLLQQKQQQELQQRQQHQETSRAGRRGESTKRSRMQDGGAIVFAAGSAVAAAAGAAAATAAAAPAAAPGAATAAAAAGAPHANSTAAPPPCTLTSSWASLRLQQEHQQQQPKQREEKQQQEQEQQRQQRQQQQQAPEAFSISSSDSQDFSDPRMLVADVSPLLRRIAAPAAAARTTAAAARAAAGATAMDAGATSATTHTPATAATAATAAAAAPEPTSLQMCVSHETRRASMDSGPNHANSSSRSSSRLECDVQPDFFDSQGDDPEEDDSQAALNLLLRPTPPAATPSDPPTSSNSSSSRRISSRGTSSSGSGGSSSRDEAASASPSPAVSVSLLSSGAPSGAQAAQGAPEGPEGNFRGLSTPHRLLHGAPGAPASPLRAAASLLQTGLSCSASATLRTVHKAGGGAAGGAGASKPAQSRALHDIRLFFKPA